MAHSVTAKQLRCIDRLICIESATVKISWESCHPLVFSLLSAMHKKAFTLLEMLIVIVIIAILMTIGLNMNRDALPLLKSSISQQQLLNDYQTVRSHTQNSSYYNGVHYDMASVIISGDTLSSQFGESPITRTVYSDIQVSTGLAIQLKPYTIGCQLSGSIATGVTFSIMSTIAKRSYCYHLDTATCLISTRKSIINAHDGSTSCSAGSDGPLHYTP